MDKKPFVGQLDRYIELKEKSFVASGFGGKKSTGVLVCHAWSKMEDLSGDEVQEGTIKYLVNRVYYVRWRADLRVKQNTLFLVDEGKKFEVVAMHDVGRKEYLKLVVKVYL